MAKSSSLLALQREAASRIKTCTVDGVEYRYYVGSHVIKKGPNWKVYASHPNKREADACWKALEENAEAPVSPTVLNAERRADDEPSRRMAANIIQAHEKGRLFSQGALVMAFIAGAGMLQQKAALEHGEFGKWEKKFLGNAIPDRTRRMYKALSERIQMRLESAGTDLGRVQKLLPAPGQEIEATACEKLALVLGKVTDGKGLTELYREFELLPPKNTKSERAMKSAPRYTGVEHLDRAASATAWVDNLCALIYPKTDPKTGEGVLDAAPYRHGPHLDTDGLNRVLQALVDCAHYLEVPVSELVNLKPQAQRPDGKI